MTSKGPFQPKAFHDSTILFCTSTIPECPSPQKSPLKHPRRGSLSCCMLQRAKNPSSQVLRKTLSCKLICALQLQGTTGAPRTPGRGDAGPGQGGWTTITCLVWGLTRYTGVSHSIAKETWPSLAPFPCLTQGIIRTKWPYRHAGQHCEQGISHTAVLVPHRKDY